MLIFKFNEDRMKNIETSKRVDSCRDGWGYISKFQNIFIKFRTDCLIYKKKLHNFLKGPAYNNTKNH